MGAKKETVVEENTLSVDRAVKLREIYADGLQTEFWKAIEEQLKLRRELAFRNLAAADEPGVAMKMAAYVAAFDFLTNYPKACLAQCDEVIKAHTPRADLAGASAAVDEAKKYLSVVPPTTRPSAQEQVAAAMAESGAEGA